MNQQSGKNDVRRSVQVQVTLHNPTAGQAPPATRAYLFDRAGRLVDSKPVTDKDIAFDVAPNQDYRVTVGPDLIGKAKEAPPNLVAQLAKASAISQDVLRNAKQDALAFRVYPNIWFCWFPTCINVHGTVQKAGVGPICTGTVQIFQVDLGCTLDSFTFFDLSRLRYRLIAKLSVDTVAFQQKMTSRATVLEARANTQVSMASTSASAASARAVTTSSLSDAVVTLSALEGGALKQYLVANRALFYWFWCELIPDTAFCWQELGEVAIQSDGSFSAEVCFWCPQDYPDLYFEVIQNIDGATVEISDPQIACSTYYNYDGSGSVDITVTDPRAIACLPTGIGPGYLFVWPTAIGNQDLGGIDGLETLTGTGLLPGNTPWGGTLPLQMIFHPDLQANNVKYYRWSYRFDGDSAFSPITAAVTHRYLTIAPGPVIHLNSVNLGPVMVGAAANLFQVPDPTLSWVDINDYWDRPFAYFDSTGGGTSRRSGMCTLLLEMFDGAGNFVPCNNPVGSLNWDDQAGDPGPGNFTYLLPEIGGPPDTYATAPTPNVTDHGRLVFRILVDNNSTDGELPRVTTPSGSTDSAPCGLLNYTNGSDPVDIYYVAYHPNNFLDWELVVTRGIQGQAAATGSNTSIGSPGFPVIFENSAAMLLGNCPQAAFAVNLYCWARATNGYDRQSQYDSPKTIGFVLLEPCPPCPTLTVENLAALLRKA